MHMNARKVLFGSLLVILSAAACTKRVCPPQLSLSNCVVKPIPGSPNKYEVTCPGAPPDTLLSSDP